MKKLLAIILVLVMMCNVFTSCAYLPEGIKDTFDSVIDKVTGKGDNTDETPGDNTTETPDDNTTETPGDNTTETPGDNTTETPGDNTTETPGDNTDVHEHDFVLKETVDPNCLAVGHNTYECECGETKEEDFGEITDHDYKTYTVTAASCTRKGTTKYVCSVCKDTYTEEVPAKGHNFANFVEASRIVSCTNEYCAYSQMPDGNGKYKETIVYNYKESYYESFYAIYAELDAIINAAELYDPDKHGYAEGSELEIKYLAMEAKYEELYDIVEYIATQQQIAQIEYYVNTSIKEKEENLNFISDLRTELVAKFYEFSQPIYDSMYRDYYYYGMSEEEIKAFIFDSNAVANPEYKRLIDRNNEIELEFHNMVTPQIDTKLPELYAEFVSNNKQIAALLGYDNYLEYAYENVYGRDYSYTDVATVERHVKKYLISAYNSLNNKFNNMKYTNADIVEYKSQFESSFFTNKVGNRTLNDYIDLLNFSNGISFSDEFNNLMADGNLFRGKYEGAFVTSLMSYNLPIAYFGSGYDNPFTVAHEFGHFMNEIYNKGEFNQSFDLLEMHSQGNEMLYLYFLQGELTDGGFALCETLQLLNTLSTVMAAMAVDTFERAVYLDTYMGTYADVIMADNTITADEYDMLFKGILSDYGMAGKITDAYWRYVTISSPCYYVSYAVSAISVLQLYTIAENESFEAAQDAYLKLFTYTDVNPDMTTEEILIYAGMKSFMDEELYAELEALMASL